MSQRSNMLHQCAELEAVLHSESTNSFSNELGAILSSHCIICPDSARWCNVVNRMIRFFAELRCERIGIIYVAQLRSGGSSLTCKMFKFAISLL